MTVPFVTIFDFLKFNFLYFTPQSSKRLKLPQNGRTDTNFTATLRRQFSETEAFVSWRCCAHPLPFCVLRFSGPSSPLCSVRIFYRMCELIPAPDTSPFFVLSSRSGRFVSVFRAGLRAANVPQARVFLKRRPLPD